MITPKLLFQMAKACSIADEPHVSIVTHEDGSRYAVWRLGVALLPSTVLADTSDGTWRIYANGSIEGRSDRVSDVHVRERILPLLDRPVRVPITETPWLCEAGSRLNRLVKRNDGHAVVVDNALWSPWQEASRLPVWQAGGVISPLLWAPDGGGRAEGLLMPIRLGEVMQVPGVYQDAVANALEVARVR
ncbi:hypothetical protein AB0J63_26790 [Streptosporangium canum]|uniref:hypothetical protein n=1 Tax=Streptosporangium canum TaxID=324952 RepID=UPI00341F9EA9